MECLQSAVLPRPEHSRFLRNAGRSWPPAWTGSRIQPCSLKDFKPVTGLRPMQASATSEAASVAKMLSFRPTTSRTRPTRMSLWWLRTVKILPKHPASPRMRQRDMRFASPHAVFTQAESTWSGETEALFLSAKQSIARFGVRPAHPKVTRLLPRNSESYLESSEL